MKYLPCSESMMATWKFLPVPHHDGEIVSVSCLDLSHVKIIPPISDYIRRHLEEITDPSTPRSSASADITTIIATPPFDEKTTSREGAAHDPDLPEITDSKFTDGPNQSARQATEPGEGSCDERDGSNIIYWVVTLTYVLLIVVIAAMAIMLCDYHRYHKLQIANKRQRIEVDQISSKCQQCFHQQWISPPPPYSHQDFSRGNHRPVVCTRTETDV